MKDTKLIILILLFFPLNVLLLYANYERQYVIDVLLTSQKPDKENLRLIHPDIELPKQGIGLIVLFSD